MVINVSNLLGGFFIILLGVLFGFFLGKIFDVVFTLNVASILTLIMVLGMKVGLKKIYSKGK